MAYLIYSIEDDDNIAQIIKLTLNKQGYEVLTFANGKDFFRNVFAKKTKSNTFRYDVTRY